ncbi:hypothetical protein DH2020_046859 [Rehmannia glutinosa]|uniref:Uncharacterized protein n=1 Tax=Rehmannia glutinosa TaxID=99300 RepID=A0ABR0UAR2_REHGL
MGNQIVIECWLRLSNPNSYGRGYHRGGGSNVSYGRGNGRGQQRRTKEEKMKLLCEHCGFKGHEVTECFKLHGYRDWYKDLKEQRLGQTINMVEGVETSTPRDKVEESSKKSDYPDFASMIRKEVARYLSSQRTSGSDDIHTFCHFADCSGIKTNAQFALSLLSALGKDDWIVDTGASRHICAFPFDC